MSKVTIALIVTWVIIGLAAAGFGGYYYGKKIGAKNASCDSKDNGSIIEKNADNPENSPSSSPSGNDKNIQSPSSSPTSSGDTEQKTVK